MKTTLSVITFLIIGAMIVVNGAYISIEGIINDAIAATNRVNIHQFTIALELYYIDNDTYPIVEGGEELVGALYDNGYIKNKPLDLDIFDYKPINNGQDYLLKVKK